MGSHVFQYHDGIVHHHTYRNGQGTEGNNIEGISGYQQIGKRRKKRNRDGQDNDKGRAPSPQKDEYHQHYHDKRNDNGLFQAVHRIEDIIGGIHDNAQFHIGRKSFLDFRQFLQHFLGNVYRIGAGLFLDYDHSALFSVVEGLLRAFLQPVLDSGDIFQINSLAVIMAHHQIQHFIGIGKLFLHPERISIGTYIYGTARSIAVFLRDESGDGLYGYPIGFQLVRIAIYIDLAHGSSRYGYRAHPADPCQRIGHHIVQYFIQAVSTFLGRYGKQQDRDIIGSEFENDRILRLVGQYRFYHIQLVPHIIRSHIYIYPVFEFQGYNGNILPGFGGNMFEIAHAVQRIFQRFGYVILDIGSTGTGIGSQDHNGIGFYFREQIYRKPGKRKDTEEHDGDKNQGRRNRFFYCRLIYTHFSSSIF